MWRPETPETPETLGRCQSRPPRVPIRQPGPETSGNPDLPAKRAIRAPLPMAFSLLEGLATPSAH